MLISMALCRAGLAKAGGEARRLISSQQVYVCGVLVETPILWLTPGTYTLRANKKTVTFTVE